MSDPAATTRNFQQFRKRLWHLGSKEFGNKGNDAVFVVATELPRPLSGPRDAKGAPSPLVEEGRMPVRAVIRSRGRKPIGLRREFDLRELRATIPEPLPSPRSPNFDRSSLLAPFSTDGALLSPAARAGPTTRRATAAQRRLGYGGTCPSTERRSGAGPQPIPIRE